MLLEGCQSDCEAISFRICATNNKFFSVAVFFFTDNECTMLLQNKFLRICVSKKKMFYPKARSLILHVSPGSYSIFLKAKHRSRRTSVMHSRTSQKYFIEVETWQTYKHTSTMTIARNMKEHREERVTGYNKLSMLPFLLFFLSPSYYLKTGLNFRLRVFVFFDTSIALSLSTSSICSVNFFVTEPTLQVIVVH